MKRVLIVSHLLPPWFMGGTPRLLRWCRALPALGWQPVLAGFSDYPIASQLGALPPEIEHYSLPFESRSGLLGKVARRLGAQHRAQQWPDAFAPRVMELAELLAKHQIKAEITMVSAPSFSLLQTDFLRALRESIDAPLVLDLRDAFAENSGFADAPALQARARALEIAAAPWLDGVATVSATFARLLPTWFPKVKEHALITNAFERAAHLPFRSDVAWPGKREGVLRLTFVGHAYGSRAPALLLEGFRRAIAQEPGLASVLRLRMVGHCQEEALGDWSEWPALIEKEAPVPYAEIPRVLSQADVLLLVIGDDPLLDGVPGAKVYEYLGARRPIFCLSQGAAARIVRRTESGVIANPKRPEQVRDALLYLYRNWRDDRPFVMADEARSERFEIASVAGELASFFDRVRASSSASPRA